MQNDRVMGLLGRIGVAAGISVVLTLLLVLLFQDAPPPPREVMEASGMVPAQSEPGIRPISLR